MKRNFLLVFGGDDDANDDDDSTRWMRGRLSLCECVCV